MNPTPVRTSFPRLRLSQLVARSGGIGRDQAIEEAMKGVESLRAEGDETIMRLIAEIDSVMNGCRGKALATDAIQLVLQAADQIVTLAGTFGYPSVASVGRSLCDVADGLIKSGIHDSAPIAVHVQSLHLLASGGASLSAAQTETVLAELAKVLVHYNFGSLADEADGEEATLAV